MKILWLVNIVLPEFAKAIGQNVLNQGGWLPSLVDAVRRFAPHLKLTIVCAGNWTVSEIINGVTYVQHDCRSGRDSAVREMIDRIHPSLVHIHGSEGCWAGVRKEAFIGCPVVVSLQGIISGCYPHYCGCLMPSETFSIANLPNMLITRYWITRAARIWRTRLSRVEKNAFRDFDAYLGRTEWDKAWTEYLNPSAKYIHVGEILRQPFYRGGRTKSTIVPRTIFCGASLGYPLKGGHWLLRAVKSLSRKYTDVQLRVANSEKVKPPKNMLASLKQGEYHRYASHLIRKLGIEKNVVLLPSLTADEIANELRCAEVFCLPSLCENSPNSLGEAMIMGCPCVAADVGGIQTILKNRVQGVLVPPADPAMLAHEISRLFDDAMLAQKYANAALEDAKVRYDPQKVVAELIDAYQRVVRK